MLKSRSISLSGRCTNHGIFLKTVWSRKMKYLITVPNRDKVTEELESGLMTTPASFEAFRHNVTHHSGDTAGGMQGLTYAMMKDWPEKVLRTVFDLLSNL